MNKKHNKKFKNEPEKDPIEEVLSPWISVPIVVFFYLMTRQFLLSSQHVIIWNSQYNLYMDYILSHQEVKPDIPEVDEILEIVEDFQRGSSTLKEEEEDEASGTADVRFGGGSNIGDTPLLNKHGDLPSAVLGRGKLSLKDIQIMEDGPDYKSTIRQIHKKYDTNNLVLPKIIDNQIIYQKKVDALIKLDPKYKKFIPLNPKISFEQLDNKKLYDYFGAKWDPPVDLAWINNQTLNVGNMIKPPSPLITKNNYCGSLMTLGYWRYQGQDHERCSVYQCPDCKRQLWVSQNCKMLRYNNVLVKKLLDAMNNNNNKKQLIFIGNANARQMYLGYTNVFANKAKYDMFIDQGPDPENKEKIFGTANSPARYFPATNLMRVFEILQELSEISLSTTYAFIISGPFDGDEPMDNQMTLDLILEVVFDNIIEKSEKRIKIVYVPFQPEGQNEAKSNDLFVKNKIVPLLPRSIIYQNFAYMEASIRTYYDFNYENDFQNSKNLGRATPIEKLKVGENNAIALEARPGLGLKFPVNESAVLTTSLWTDINLMLNFVFNQRMSNVFDRNTEFDRGNNGWNCCLIDELGE